MRVEVTREFKYGGETLEEGTVQDLPDSAAESAIDKGYAERAEEEVPEIEEEIPGIKKPEEEPETVWDEIDRELDEERGGELPPKWKPSEREDHPDRIKGVVDRTGPDSFGRTLIIEDLNGDEWFIPSGRKALEDFLKRATVGDKVGLQYLGMEKSGETGRKYENYRTVVKEG